MQLRTTIMCSILITNIFSAIFLFTIFIPIYKHNYFAHFLGQLFPQILISVINHDYFVFLELLQNYFLAYYYT